MDICLDVTKGLEAIHRQGMIHRDIKPENIICVERTYKITDFGSLESGTVGEGHIGTPLYLPPEILFAGEEEEGKMGGGRGGGHRGDQGINKKGGMSHLQEEEGSYDQRIDVWSLGVTLF